MYVRIRIDTSLGRQGENFFFGVNRFRLVVNVENDLAFFVRRHALGHDSIRTIYVE
jgi:hypothetical protein